VDVTWTAPTRNADGTPLTDLASYRVYFATRENRTVQAVPSSLTSPGTGQRVTFRLTGLTMGELYYAAIIAVNSVGKSSGCSIAASVRAHE
jgi:hypothetical protein